MRKNEKEKKTPGNFPLHPYRQYPRKERIEITRWPHLSLLSKGYADPHPSYPSRRAINLRIPHERKPGGIFPFSASADIPFSSLSCERSVSQGGSPRHFEYTTLTSPDILILYWVFLLVFTPSSAGEYVGGFAKRGTEGEGVLSS